MASREWLFHTFGRVEEYRTLYGAGISASHVTMLEQNQRTPRFKSLRGLCNALGLEGEEFAVFCDAALRRAPPHMRDLPADSLGSAPDIVTEHYSSSLASTTPQKRLQHLLRAR